MALSWIVTCPAAAQDYEIQIEGNKVTKTRYITKIILNCLKESPNSSGLEIAQCLLNERVFVSARVDRNQNRIQIFVEERFPIFGIPIVKIDSSASRRFGIFLIHTNLFGLGKKLGVNFMSSNGNPSYGLFLKDSSLFHSKWNSILILRNQHDVYELDVGKHDKGLINKIDERVKIFRFDL
jgi:hypothetical protein